MSISSSKNNSTNTSDGKEEKMYEESPDSKEGVSRTMAQVDPTQAIAMFGTSKTNKYDFLNVVGNRKLIKAINRQSAKGGIESESVKFSDTVLRPGQTGKKIFRDMIITDRCIYSFDPGRYAKTHRVIDIASLKAIIISKYRNSDDICFQFTDEPDILVKMVRRAEVVECLCELFQQYTGRTIKPQLAEESDLSIFVLKKKPKTKLIKLMEKVERSRTTAEKGDIVQHHAGWLSKRGVTRSRWRRRYFILSQTNLLYYFARPKRNVTLQPEAICKRWIKSELKSKEKSSSVVSCNNCLARFGFFRIRHSCRQCGQIYCDSCMSLKALLPLVRVCTMCYSALQYGHHAFFVIPNTRQRKVIRLAAETEEMATRWVETITNAIKFSQATNVTTRPSSTSSPPVPENPTPTSRTSSSAAVISPRQLARKASLLRATSQPVSPLLTVSPSRRLSTDLKSAPKYHNLNAPHIEGWLRCEVSKEIWQRRYFSVEGSLLWFYEMDLRGNINLSDGAGIHPVHEISPTLPRNESNFTGYQSKSSFAHRFNIATPQRVFKVAADSPEEKTAWIEQVNLTINQSRIKTEQHSLGPKQGSFSVLSFDHEEKPSRSLLKPNPPSVFIGAPTGQVTFVFSNIQDSTRFWDDIPVSMGKALQKHEKVLRELSKIHRGYEVKNELDGFMTAFGSVLDAMLWCCAVQRALMQSEWPPDILTHPCTARGFDDNGQVVFNGLRMRMGVHIGFPAIRENPVTSRMDYFGTVVNRCARISSSANGGQILLSEDVYNEYEKLVKKTPDFATDHEKKLFNDIRITKLGSTFFKGIKEAVNIYQLLPVELSTRKFEPIKRDVKLSNASLLPTFNMNFPIEEDSPLDESPLDEEENRVYDSDSEDADYWDFWGSTPNQNN